MTKNALDKLKNYKDFKVNDVYFENYLEAKKYKQELLNADMSVVFSGYDKRIKHRVNFYIYCKLPKFEKRPLEI